MERQNISYLLHAGSDDDEEQWNVSGAGALMAMPGGEGRHEGESGQGLPEHEAAGAEWAASGESSGEGPSAAAGAAMCLLDEGSQEDTCGSGSSQENEQQPLESGHQGMGDNDGVQHTSMAARWACTHPVRILVPGCRPRHHHRFTLPQLQELENAFQRNHYLSPAEAKRMAACMGVTEARVQRWFWKRREQYRRYRRL